MEQRTREEEISERKSNGNLKMTSESLSEIPQGCSKNNS